jgi:hypothetical protein
MPRQGTSSRRRDDPVAPPDAPESVIDPLPEEPVHEAPPELDQDVAPPATPDPLEAGFPEAEELPPAIAAKPKRGRLVLQLILVAIVGLAVGFTAVVLM